MGTDVNAGSRWVSQSEASGRVLFVWLIATLLGIFGSVDNWVLWIVSAFLFAIAWGGAQALKDGVPE